MLIFCSIVLYHPDRDNLQKNICAVAPQVDHIIFVDNGSDERDQIEEIIAGCALKAEQYTIIWNDNNLGIAKALNQALEFSEERGAEWLLTLDQDSVVPDNMIAEYRKFLNLEKAGQITCYFYNPDNGFTDCEVDLEKSVTELELCITSGALHNVPACCEIGGFDERLFIDAVDYDISFRLREKGYHVYGISSVQMKHHVGNMVLKKFLFFHYWDYQYSTMRVYYQARNNIYMLRRFKGSQTIFLKNLISNLGRNVLSGRVKLLGTFCKGVRDGFRMEVREE